MQGGDQREDPARRVEIALDLALQPIFEKMRRARNARVVVADTLLATSLQRIVVQIEGGVRDFSHVFFDDPLVLRGGRNEAGFEKRAVVIEAIALIKDAARCLGAGVAR